MACQTCRRRKVRCDRARLTCKNCGERALNCVYHGERRLKRLRESGPAVEGGSRNPTTTHSPSRCSSSSLPPVWSLGTSTQSQSRPFTVGSDSLLDNLLAPGVQSAPTHRSSSVWIRTERGDEYTGPSSGISAISDQGLAWIKRQTDGCESLCAAVTHVRRTLLSHLRQPKCVAPGLWDMHPVRAPSKDLPPWETIREYGDAYFDRVQVTFPIVNRDQFKLELAQFCEGTPARSVSWRALLFAVLASGCRAAQSDETAVAFRASGSEAWGYFVVALSMEQSLVHVATDLTAVQALAVMTVFAQGMSSPQRLEYTLCSTTVRVAQSIALHCDPPTEWELSAFEQEERARTFWVVYCLDKTLALRCGRPSIIDDAEISCRYHPPVDATSGSPSGDATFDFFLSFCRLSRIYGNISRHLHSAFALSQTCNEIVDTAVQLLVAVQGWQAAIPPKERLRRVSRDSESIDSPPKSQVLFLQMSYYYALCAIYRRFTPLFCHADEDIDQASSLLDGACPVSHIEAARCMVLLTKHIDVEAYSPGWLVFYWPMTALLTVFVHLLCNPQDPSAQHDIALMEVAVGFFGRVEYMTSGEAGFTQVAEFVRQARLSIDRTAAPPAEGDRLAFSARARQSDVERTPYANGAAHPSPQEGQAESQAEPVTSVFDLSNLQMQDHVAVSEAGLVPWPQSICDSLPDDWPCTNDWNVTQAPLLNT